MTIDHVLSWLLLSLYGAYDEMVMPWITCLT